VAPLENGVVWVWHVNHIKCDVFGAGSFGVTEGYRECDGPDRFDSFPIKAIEGRRQFFELLLVKTHFVEGCQEEDFGLTAIVNEDFFDVPFINVDCDDHGVSVWK
jgi:hypothetical protein